MACNRSGSALWQDKSIAPKNIREFLNPDWLKVVYRDVKSKAL
jgi:hypothetical protein